MLIVATTAPVPMLLVPAPVLRLKAAIVPPLTATPPPATFAVAKLSAAARVNVPLPILARLPPEAVRAVAQVTFWPLVSTL